MKTSIIISGNHDFTDARYKSVGKYFEETGYGTVFHVPNYALGSIEKLVDEFLKKLSTDSQQLTFFGFSLGAMLALVASTKVELENLILCSPAGYFKEYASLLTEDDMEWAKKHLSDFEKWSAAETVRQSKAKHGYIVAGEKELAAWEDFRHWVSDLQAQTSWPLTVVPGTAHEIEALKYQDAIQAIIQNLD